MERDKLTGKSLRERLKQLEIARNLLPAGVVAVAILGALRGVGEADFSKITSASELGPTPRVLPTPEDVAGKMKEFEATVEAINRGPQHIIGESTPAGDSLRIIDTEVGELSFELNVDSEDFSKQEAEWLEKTLPEIIQVYKNIFGESFYEGKITIRKGDVSGECDLGSHACVFPSTGEIIWDEEVDLLTSSRKIGTFAHELGHIFSGNYFWEKEMDKLFGLEGLMSNHSSFTFGEEKIIQAKMGEKVHFVSLEGDIFYQAYKYNPRFFLKLREIYEDKGRPQIQTREQWLAIAEEVSPGFSSWLESALRGPEYSLPEPQGKEFNWKTIPPPTSEGNPRELFWILPEPTRWFMPSFGHWEAVCLRKGVNDYLVWPIVDEKRYPEIGPEGTLPVYNAGSIERDPTRDALGEWR